MSNQVYSVPYGTVRLHDPSQPIIGLSSSPYADLISNGGNRGDHPQSNSNGHSNSNSNSNSNGSLSLAGSPTPSIDGEDQDNSADYSPESTRNQNSRSKSTPKPRGKRASSKGSSTTNTSNNGKKIGGKKTAAGGAKKKGGNLGNNSIVTGGLSEHDELTGRRKIRIQFVEDDNRRHVTFSKRKAGIMKKAYELATLTGTQVLLLIVSQTDQVFTFATPKLQPIVMESEGQQLIQHCLQVPDPDLKYDDEEGEYEEEEEQEDQGHSPVKVEEELDDNQDKEDPIFDGEEGLQNGNGNDEGLETIHENFDQVNDEEGIVTLNNTPQKKFIGNSKKTSKTSSTTTNNKAKGRKRFSSTSTKNHSQKEVENEEREQEEEEELNLPPALIQRHAPSGKILDEEDSRRPNKRSRDEMTNDSLVSLHSNSNEFGLNTSNNSSTNNNSNPLEINMNVNTSVGSYYDSSNNNNNNNNNSNSSTSNSTSSTSTSNHPNNSHLNHNHNHSDYNSPQLTGSSPTSGHWNHHHSSSSSGGGGGVGRDEDRFSNGLNGLNHDSSMSTIFNPSSTATTTSSNYSGGLRVGNSSYGNGNGNGGFELGWEV